VAEALRARGYYTSAFVANLIAAQHDSGLNRGFLRYEDFELLGTSFFLSTLVGQRIARPKPFNRGPIRYYPMKIAPSVTQDFLDWLPEAEGRPFFAFLNYIDAHHGFPAPEDLKRKFGQKGRMNKYDAAIGSLDRQLDRLLSELERRGLRDNTMVILASDHGEQFGEKGLFQHGNSLYQPAMVVPLVIWLPGDRHGGQRVQAPVSLQDLALTVLEEAGVTTEEDFGGRSLSRYWAADGRPVTDTLIGGLQARIGTPNAEPNSKGDMNALHTAQHSYILNGDGTEELFDLRTDSAEAINLANDPANALLLAGFRSYLRAQVPQHWLTSLQTKSDNRLNVSADRR
jgi:arylsulfatase A-like enzyme